MIGFIVTLLLSLAFLVGNVYKPSVFSPDIRFSLLDTSVLLTWILAIIFRYPNLIHNFHSHNRLWRSIAGFSIISLISLIFSGYRFGFMALISGFMYLLRWTAYSLLAFPLIAVLSSKSRSRLKIILAAILFFTGVAQYLFFPDIRPLVMENWDPHYFRIVGTLLDPGYLGFLYFAILMTINSALFWIPVYLIFAFTYSRSSYLAFLAGSAYLAKFTRSWKYLLACVFLIVVTMMSLPRNSDGEGVKLERTNSIYSRLDNWGQSLTIFVRNPILGVGFNTYRYAKRAYGFSPSSKWLTSHADAGADSSILFVAATTGLIGLFIYCLYLLTIYKYLEPSLNNKIILIGLLFHSCFLNSLFYPFIMFWLALLLSESMDYKIR